MIWSAVNLSAVSIAFALLVVACLTNHFAECASTPMWTTLCTLSGNVFYLKAFGFDAIKTAGDNASHVYLIDLVRWCLGIQAGGAFVAWVLYVWLADKRWYMGTTVLTHLLGWILLVTVIAEVPHFNALIDPTVIGSQANSELSFGNGIVISVVATVLQLLTVFSVFAKNQMRKHRVY